MTLNDECEHGDWVWVIEAEEIYCRDCGTMFIAPDIER